MLREQFNYIKYHIVNHGKVFFIGLYLDPLSTDETIADLLEISYNDYYNKLINKFNALYSNFYNSLCFESRKDAEAALNWIEGIEKEIKFKYAKDTY